MPLNSDPQKPKDRVRQVSMLATASSIGLSLVIAIFLGTAGGLYIDRHFGTKPWGFIIGLILGVAAGYRNIYILATRLDNQQRKSNDHDGS